jgi:hypothetical protein
VLVEVGLEPVERPAGVGPAEVPGVGQRRRDHDGDLLGGVGRGPPLAGPVAEAVEALGVEAVQPLVDLVAAQTDRRGDGGGPLAAGQGVDGADALDQPDLVGAGAHELCDGLPLLGRQLAESDLGSHGAPPARVAPIL